MKKVILPKPCSENWNEMTPTEKGAYCQKCQLEVMDFTQKSNDQIREILIANQGKRTCGHISKTQLDSINIDYSFWEKPTILSIRSRLLYACVMVFGMTLFTGCEFMDEPHDVGEIEMVDGGMMIEDDTTSSCDNSNNLVDGEMMLEGEIMMEDDVE